MGDGMKLTTLGAIVCIAGTSLQAQEAVTTPFDGSFEDATFAVESAIVDKGLVIDSVSHVGAMLNRTGADVGSEKTLFKAADVFLFCSAVVSREVMEADPMNIMHCPYGVFVAENADAASGQLAPSLAAFNLSPSVFVGGVPMLVTKGFGSSRSSARIRYTLPRLAWK